MDWTKIALLIVMIAAAASAARVCYSCRSDTDDTCNDPFTGNNKVSCNKKCYKVIDEIGGRKTTYRGCGHTNPAFDCVEGKGVEGGVKREVSCCDGDRCNGAATSKATGAIVGFIGVTAWKFLF